MFPRVLDFRGRVTCLNVQGNFATVRGEITQTREASVPVGPGVLITVVDNGEPGDHDESITFFDLPTPPTVCPAPTISVGFNGGNYVVHDAAP